MDLFKQKAFLHFKDKTFSGVLVCSEKITNLELWGESVFTTSQTGYQESITDPSFLGQHLCFSYPHIGNYPFNPRDNQSDKPHVSSVICHKIHYNDFFRRYKIPVLSEVDTRELIKYITTICDNQISVLSLSSERPAASVFSEDKLHCEDLDKVTNPNTQTIIEGENPICFMDYGSKQAIINQFKDLGYPLRIFNHTASAKEVLELDPRLIFLSNGPGDPKKYLYQIEQIRNFISNKIPIRAICLGHQLLAEALGAKTYKLPFGHRGGNHPVFDLTTGKVVITSQNHGYAVDEKSFESVLDDNISERELFISHKSLFDQSIEGISSKDNFLKSVQFHPEAKPGPLDTLSFFTDIDKYLKGEFQDNNSKQVATPPDVIRKRFKKDIPYKRVLIIGSGPIKIGQASEFDYSGTQAIKALKEEGIQVVLLNSNPATIMTDENLADATYIEPISLDSLKKIILKENIDAIITTMGGQTALNLSLQLHDSGFLDDKNITILGAKKETVEKTEDRDLFAAELDILGYTTCSRVKVHSVDEAIKSAQTEIGFPLIIRRDFALGGKGSTTIYSEEELKSFLGHRSEYPVSLERSLLGFKEVELEVMVDQEQNGVIICSIENIDPCGVHTGDSITVAPAQTISDHCMQQLRTMTIKIAIHMGVVTGGANVQFAINPKDENDIVVIEMNPRVSRSSALASKATGYPIAKISTKLALGYTLSEILNDITKNSPVSFEPTQDYVAVKIPLFPFHKFPRTKRILGTQMRSVGEVLAIGSNFNEAFFKALRSLEMGLEVPRLSLLKDPDYIPTLKGIEERLSQFRELSLLTCLEGIRRGYSVDYINGLSSIDKWFIERMMDFFNLESGLIEQESSLDNTETLLELKRNGFSDKYLALLTNKNEDQILKLRLENKIIPSYRAVDTCSGEFIAYTPYFYSTYQSYNEAKPLGNALVITGSGPNRIGQGIEFDYSCVKACEATRECGKNAIMINSNPETVSTDYDSSDRLYLSPLYEEDVFDILCHENPDGIIWSFAGQTGIRLRERIDLGFRSRLRTFNFLGSPSETLDLCEDRKAFSEVIQSLDLSLTRSQEIRTYRELLEVLEEIGFPVIMRPSYVIGGESMFIIKNLMDIDNLPDYAIQHLNGGKTTFLVENYIENAFEYDVDLVRDEFGNHIVCICEHIEHAGVHSGDSGMITPPIQITKETQSRLIKIAKQLSTKLKIVGPINIQFAIKGEDIYCIEANPRGSRTIPFLSKAYHRSLSTYAVKAMLGQKIEPIENIDLNYYCVKQSTFPFDRFLDDHNILGPIMKSTGETMGIDYKLTDAIIKSYQANFPNFTEAGKILISLSDESKKTIGPLLKSLRDTKHEVYATPGTFGFLQALDINCTRVEKLHKDDKRINIRDILQDPELGAVINTPYNSGKAKSDGDVIRGLAALKGAAVFTREENIVSFLESFKEFNQETTQPYSLQELK